MSLLFWTVAGVALLAVGGMLFWVWLAIWLDDHKSDGQKSMADRREEESKLPCSASITSTVKQSLLVFEPCVYQFPELDGDGIFSLLDDNYGSIAIRTKEMCLEDQQPIFEVCGPSSLGMDEDEYPFESEDEEILHYLDGAKDICAILLDAGITPPLLVTINDKDYELRKIEKSS